MTASFGAGRRIAALSVAIALFAAPVASAQSPGAAPSNPASPNARLLSPAAFARLIKARPADLAPAPVMAGAPRLDLLQQATAAMARLAPAVSMPRQQQRSWVARHKVATGVLVGLAVFFGAYFIWYGHDCAPHNDCFD
jgi:hypothetical protein